MINCSDCGNKAFNNIYKDVLYCDICTECLVYEFYGFDRKGSNKEQMLEDSKAIRFYSDLYLGKAKKHGITEVKKEIVLELINEVRTNGIDGIQDMIQKFIEEETK